MAPPRKTPPATQALAWWSDTLAVWRWQPLALARLTAISLGWGLGLGLLMGLGYWLTRPLGLLGGVLQGMLSAAWAGLALVSTSALWSGHLRNTPERLAAIPRQVFWLLTLMLGAAYNLSLFGWGILLVALAPAGMATAAATTAEWNQYFAQHASALTRLAYLFVAGAVVLTGAWWALSVALWEFRQPLSVASTRLVRGALRAGPALLWWLLPAAALVGGWFHGTAGLYRLLGEGLAWLSLGVAAAVGVGLVLPLLLVALVRVVRALGELAPHQS